jgi:hypothetical protein
MQIVNGCKMILTDRGLVVIPPTSDADPKPDPKPAQGEKR